MIPTTMQNTRRGLIIGLAFSLLFSLLFSLFLGLSGNSFAECSKSAITPLSESSVSRSSRIAKISKIKEVSKVFLEAIDPADIKLEETMTASFRHKFKAVLIDAQDYLKKQKSFTGTESEPKPFKGAVVLDLDETVLDNRAYFIIHKRYDATLWNQWMRRGEAPVLPEALEFIQWLQAEDFRVYFVTGRPERFRKVTIENLERVGITQFDGLYMKPDVYNHSSARHFKIDARSEIESQGTPVLIILGDQESDLRGGHGVGFKLPNPIYFIP